MGSISSAVVFLIDESFSQQQRLVESMRSKMESIATTLNSTLARMGDSPTVDVALVGYHQSADGRMNVGSRWGGGFAGRTWVSSAELRNSPLRVETRNRQVPDPVAGVRQETVEFPVWYDPVFFGGAIPRAAAYDFVAETLLAWMAGRELAQPPLIVSFLGELSPADPLGQSVIPLGKVNTPVGFPLLIQFYPGTNAVVPTIKYPASANFLPPGPIQEMFYACSSLDDGMIQSLRQSGEMVAAGAKGLVYNGRMVDLVRFLWLVREFAARMESGVWSVESEEVSLSGKESSETPKEENSVTEGTPDDSPAHLLTCSPVHPYCTPFPENTLPDEPADLPPRKTLVILLVDRSVSDVTYRPAADAWDRRLDKLHFMLGELSRRGRGQYDVSLIFYGQNADGSPSVEEMTLGREFLPDSLLLAAAGRVEEFRMQVPNGIGGIISLPRKKLSFADVTPTPTADPVPAFRRSMEVIRLWNEVRPQKILQPMLLHITAGEFQMERLDEAIRELSGPGLPPVWLHHWVFTERPHVGVCCPGELPETEDEKIVRLWEQSDPLPGRELLAGVRPGIAEDSRGMMVNMDFDILFEVIGTLGEGGAG